MKNESLKILQTPYSAPASYQDLAEPQAESSIVEPPGIGTPFLSSEKFEQPPSAENPFYVALFTTMFCSALGSLIVHSSEIIGGVSASCSLFVSCVRVVLRALQ